MKQVRRAVTVDEALQSIIQECPLGPIENISIDDSYGRVLAKDIQAHEPVPAFRRSGMDGYAILSIDTKGASRETPVEMKVIERVAAGDVPSQLVSSGMATRIMTGAMMPVLADAVIMQEKVEVLEKEEGRWIRLFEEIPPERHVAKVGEDISLGDALISAGKRLTAGDLALLATFGYQNVEVRKQPKVGIIASGAELVAIDGTVPAGKIRNSNSYMIMAQVRKYGGIPKLFGIIPDDKEEAKKAIKSALDEVDFLVTSGGVSVGDFDLMPAVFEELGAKLLFDRVAMRPGKPTTVAMIEQKIIFGLSGNPSACFVGFELFAKPALLGFQGFHCVDSKPIQVAMDTDFNYTSPFLTFIRGIAFVEDGIMKANPLHKNKASMMSSLNQTNCFLLIPPGDLKFSRNDKVEILLFGDLV